MRIPASAVPLLLLVLGAATALPAAASPEPARSSGTVVLDRVLAFVEGDPILASEVDGVIALRLVEPLEGESTEALQRRTLDLLVDDRLRARDLARFGEPEIPADDIEDEIDRAASRVGGRAKLEEIALAHGLDAASLRALFRRQLAAIQAADDRFGGSVVVDDQEIADFVECDPEFRAGLAASGVEETPRLTPELANEIRGLLVRRKLGEQLDQWMKELRAKGKVEYRDGR